MIRSVRLALRVLVWIAGLVALLLGGVALWLSLRPLDLGFLVPRLEEAARGPDFSTRIERAALVWHLVHGPEIRAEGISVQEDTGLEVARLPVVSLALSPRALLRGQVAITSLAIEAPTLRVVRSDRGEVEVGIEDEDLELREGPAPMQELIRVLAAPPSPDTPLGALRRVSILSASVSVEDRLLGIDWGAPRATVELRRRPRGVSGRLDADLQLGESAGHAGAELEWQRGERTAALEIDFEGIDPRPLLRAGLGRELDLPALRSLRLTGSGRARITGGWPFAESAEVDLTAGPISAQLRSEPTARGVRYAIRADLEGLDVAELEAWWPPDAADGARRWVLENIRGGRVSQLRLDLALDLRGEPEPGIGLASLDGRFEAEDLSVHYLGDLPVAQEVYSSAGVDLESFRFEIHRGRVGALQVSGGELSIRELGTEHPPFDLELEFETPVREALEILDRAPIEISQQTGIPPERFGGQGRGRLDVRFPLSKHLELRDVELFVEADVAEGSLSDPDLGIELSGGQLHLDAWTEGLAVSGPLRLNDRPAELLWQDRFDDEEGLRRLNLDAELAPTSDGRPGLELRLDARRDGETWRRLGSRVELEGSEPHEALYLHGAEGKSFRARSPDLGLLLSGLDIDSRLRGGRLEIDGASPQPEQPLAGHFALHDFQLAETPLVAVLLNSLALITLRELLSSEGLHWDLLDGDFRYSPDGRLELLDAQAQGSSLVITAEGSLQGRAIDLEGMAIPLSRINRLGGRVPVLGRLLVGSDGSLLAAHYRATGPIEDPEVQVDPWKTIVPSLLRDLIGGAASALR